MKVNDVLTEGIWDNLKGAATAGNAEFQKRQSFDNVQKNVKGFVAADSKSISKEWQNAQHSLPNFNKIAHNPAQYYKQVALFAANKLNTAVPKGIVAPATIDPQGILDVITKVAANFHYARAATQTGGAVGAPKPATSTKQRGPNGRFTAANPAPAGTPATSPTKPAKAGKVAAPATPTPPTPPKAGTPVPGMSGHVYSGEVGPTGKPKVIPAPAATPKAGPLPIKPKSKTKASSIDIDAALKMADSLSPEEKKKLLQDLLKSGVKVSAGGA